ncbi:MAG: M16 family metallopeptidase [Myxococcota bacterium]
MHFPHRWALALAASLVACATVPPSQRAEDDIRRGPQIPYERYQLSNGLTVILHEDHRLPLVAVSVWYDVGALHEPPGRSGFAHLFEHMMFQGSAHVPEDQHFQILQEVGGSNANGTTSFDRTNYFETVPSNALETALWLESDRMGYLLEAVTEESLQNQIEVVQNERRQSIENRPYGLMSERLVQELFPRPHPYYGNVIGSPEDIAAAELSDVVDFFKTYYTPANATLTLAGDFDPETVRKMVEKYFGSITGSPKPDRAVPDAPELEGPVMVEFEEPVGQLEKVSVAWLGPPALSEGAAALDILAHVLSGTRSSRLDRKVSFEDPLAQSVTASYPEYLSASIFQIDIVLKSGRTAQEALAAVDTVLQELESRPPTEEEIERAKNTWETNTYRGLQQLGGFGGKAEVLQSYHHLVGDPGRLAWDVERHARITVSDVVDAARRTLTDNRVVIIGRPKSAPVTRLHAVDGQRAVP